MGVIIREGLKTSVVNYIGVLIGTINVLFLYNKLLTSDEFGLYAILLSFPVVCVGFINMGVPHVFVRYFNRFADVQNKYHGFFTVLLIGPLLGFAVFLGLFYGFEGLFENFYKESPTLVQYAWVLPFLTFFVLYQTLLEAYFRVHFKVIVPAIIREIFLKLSNSLLVIAYYFEWISLSQMVLGLALFSGIAVLLLLYFIKRFDRLYWVWDWSIVKSPLFPEMMKYGLWTMIGGASAATLPHLEKIILAMFENGLTHTAIFTIALNIAFVISIPKNTVASISDPILAKAWATNDKQEVKNVYAKSALNLSIVGFFLFLGIWVNIDSIFEIIPNSEKYGDGKYVVLLIGLANLFDMSTGLNSEIIKNSPYYKVDFTVFILRFVLLVVANIILIPIFSYNGAAAAVLISTVLYNLAKFGFIWYKFKFQPFTLSTLKVLVLAGLAYLLAIAIDWHDGDDIIQNALEIISKGLVITIVFIGGILLWKVSPDLNNVADSVSKKLKSFLS